MFTKNVKLGKPLRISPWRKVAIGTWKTCGDPSVYAMLEVDADKAIAYVEKLSQKTGVRITLTHFVGAAIAKTIGRHPSINCILRWGRLYPRENVDVFFQVASDTRGEDLSGTVIRNADRKTIVEIASEMAVKVSRIKKNDDRDYAKMKGMMGMMPGFIVGFLIDVTAFFLYSLNLWSPVFGAPKDSFGSVMITNVGSLGIDMGFAPLVPYSRVPALITMGSAQLAPAVKDGKVVVVTRLKLCVTFDHRLIDGVHGAKMAKETERMFADPEKEFGEV